MPAKQLFIATAAIEAGTGLALGIAPALPVSLLLGASLDSPAGLVIARVAGAALLSLAVACWVSRDEIRSRTATGLVAAVLLYNLAAVVVLVHAGLGLQLSGAGLWPAALLHVAMAAWCVACLRVSR